MAKNAYVLSIKVRDLEVDDGDVVVEGGEEVDLLMRTQGLRQCWCHIDVR